MVIVNCPLMQNNVISIVEAIVRESKNPFKFVKKEGMKIFFELTDITEDDACALIKSEIRKSELGSLLNFSVIKA